jgi:hypothetical protein
MQRQVRSELPVLRIRSNVQAGGVNLNRCEELAAPALRIRSNVQAGRKPSF